MDRALRRRGPSRAVRARLPSCARVEFGTQARDR
jgi:hypothetical protein